MLVAVRLPEMSEAEHASGVAELERLVSTLGYDTVGIVTQVRTHLDAAAVLGEGSCSSWPRSRAARATSARRPRRRKTRPA